MNTISKIIYLNRVNLNNITNATYKCGCGLHTYGIEKKSKCKNKIRICKGCKSFMHGECIKEDDIKCVICAQKRKYFMCGKCGILIKNTESDHLYLYDEFGYAYKILCYDCEYVIKN